MFVVKTYLAPDAFGGRGVFAAEFVKKGSLLWKYDPAYDRFYTLEEYFKAKGKEREDLRHFSYPAIIDGVIGVMLSQDNDRYANHSETPNIMYEYDPSSENIPAPDTRHIIGLAAEDIPQGTEITEDYYGFMLPDVPMDFYKRVVTCIDFLLQPDYAQPPQSN